MTDVYNEGLGNAASIHALGVRASMVVEKARQVIAGFINSSPDEIYFTSGGTEANNIALKSVVLRRGLRGSHIVISAIEHASIMETARCLECGGVKVTRVPVDMNGVIDPRDILKSIRPSTILVSVHHANNEIGVIEPLREIGEVCRKKKVLFHTDACQSFTKVALDVKKCNADMVTLNSHKIHGPRGVGALYIKKGVELHPIMHGGKQEKGVRPGTSNTEGIAGFAKAVEISDFDDARRMSALRDYFMSEAARVIHGMTIIGPRARRLCGNISFALRGITAKSLFLELDKQGIIVSIGSACSSNALKPSHVLRAIGLSEPDAKSVVRASLCKWTTKQEMNYFLAVLRKFARAAGRNDAQ
ncbi:MAG: cysteine desulfurase family protein, partial [Candidatus Omnitrophota bacterium]